MAKKNLAWAERRANYVIECLEDGGNDDGLEDAAAIRLLIKLARLAEGV